MKRLVSGLEWVRTRRKALRLRLIGLPERVVMQARGLIFRLGGQADALAMLVSAHQAIRALACGQVG